VSLAKKIFNCRGCGARGDVIDLVKWLDNVDAIEAAQRLAIDTVNKSVNRQRGKPAKASNYEAEQHRKAAWLWSQRRPIVGTVAERYLRERRGYVGPLPPTLAFLPPHKSEHHPALIAAFALVGESEPSSLADPRNVDAIHLTLLRPDGSGKANVERPKLIVGSPLALSRKSRWDDYVGRPIVLAAPNDLMGIAVTEGIEDALSVYAATGLGVAGAAGFMPALAEAVPSYIDCVTIYAHADEAGQRRANALAERLHSRRFEVFIEGLGP
jgi:putative DNA primase/helicase